MRSPSMLPANSAVSAHLIVFNRLIRSLRGRYFTEILLRLYGVERFAHRKLHHHTK